MNIIYMGTPEFAVKAFEAIVEAGHHVTACFTQPDKPKGRGKNTVPTPVKEKALSYDIPVYQPVRLREEENEAIIRELNPDVIVVAAYGQILPERILNIPRLGCINIHASLLPKYRGAAPIEWAIIDGEKETGVTTMYMAKGLDTGDMIEKCVVPIDEKETGVTLHDKLADAGAKLIISTLKLLEAGTAVRTPQEDSLSCYASMLTKDMGKMDFAKSAAELERLIRGLQPWPCAYTFINNKNVKVYEADILELNDDELKQIKSQLYLVAGNDADIVPGMIIRVTKKNFVVACGENALVIKKLQPEGKKLMDAAAFLAGNRLEIGQVL